MASILAIMKLSSNYDDFVSNIDKIHPRYGDNLELELIGTAEDGL